RSSCSCRPQPWDPPPVPPPTGTGGILPPGPRPTPLAPRGPRPGTLTAGSAAVRERPVQERPGRLQRPGPVGGDEADAGAAVQDVLLVERSLVPHGPEQFGAGDRIPGQHRLAQPGVA